MLFVTVAVWHSEVPVSYTHLDVYKRQLIDSLLAQLKEPFLIEGFEIFTSASIGLSVYPDHGRNYEMLRRAADTAMYRIKEGAKGGAALFDTDMGLSLIHISPLITA